MPSATDSLRIAHCFGRVGAAASGTAERVALVAGVRTGRYFSIKALQENTGNVWVGFVSTMAGITNGWPLDAAQETPIWPIPGGDMYNVWIDSTAVGDKMCVVVYGNDGDGLASVTA